MTLSEFKAWFDGYTEDIVGPPTEAQWEKIKAKLIAAQASKPNYGALGLGKNAQDAFDQYVGKVRTNL